jgi:hypothetical protein
MEYFTLLFLEYFPYAEKHKIIFYVYPQKLALTPTTSGGHSVGIVRSRIEATEFSSLCAFESPPPHYDLDSWNNVLGT